MGPNASGKTTFLDTIAFLLVADGNMQSAVKGLLARPEALGIRPVDFTVVPHPERDPGVFHRGPEFLEPFRRRYRCAVMMLDREGCGREEMTRQEIEGHLGERLTTTGWGSNRSAAVVLDPELEAWWWSDSPHVSAVLGWGNRNQNLRSWLIKEQHLPEGGTKPPRPKEAVEKALRVARKPRSSALYRQLARKVSVRRCEDPAFTRFCEILRGWFPRAV